MDESKIALPAWLPWATTACLAALVACLGELWIIEKMRSQLLRDQASLAEAALKGVENQLEAERIVSRSELAGFRADARPPLRVALLLPPAGATPGGAGPAFGSVAWDPATGLGELALAAAPAQPLERDYQLWLEGPGAGYPADCGVVQAPARPDAGAFPFRMSGAVAPGCRFLLIECAKGGARTLGEAQAGGPIVLATLPIGGKISGR